MEPLTSAQSDATAEADRRELHVSVSVGLTRTHPTPPSTLTGAMTTSLSNIAMGRCLGVDLIRRCIARASLFSRPTMAVGKNNEEVSHAYAQAVYSVLTGMNSAPKAAAALETELEHIACFPKGSPPEPTETGILRANNVG
jgi:hypothetical protein